MEKVIDFHKQLLKNEKEIDLSVFLNYNEKINKIYQIINTCNHVLDSIISCLDGRTYLNNTGLIVSTRKIISDLKNISNNITIFSTEEEIDELTGKFMLVLDDYFKKINVLKKLIH